MQYEFLLLFLSQQTSFWFDNKRKTKPQISASRKTEVYFTFVLLVNKSSAPCETLWAQTLCSVLTCASTITRWGERCWQIMHWHLKLSPRSGTPSQLIYLYLIGQSKSHGHMELESQWGSAVLPHTGKQRRTSISVMRSDGYHRDLNVEL